MKHDYKAALCFLNLLDGDLKTIRHALAMMQKLQEPSGTMLGVGSIVINSIGVNEMYTNVAGRILKAMMEEAERDIIKQAEKEIYNG